MISQQFVLRRRVFVKRVASVCGLGLLVSVGGCSSQGLSLSDSGAGAYGQGATGSVPIPSEPVYGYPDTPSARAGSPAAPASGYHEASVQRGPLAPVLPAAYDGAGTDHGDPRYASGSAEPGSAAVGGSYIMQPVEDHGAKSGSYGPDAGNAGGKRYAQSGYSNGYSYGYQPRYDGYKPSYGEGRGYRPQPNDHTGSTEDDYVVVQGDTLFSIAQRFGISGSQLAELNGINGSTIYVGQHLRISGSPKYTAANQYRDGAAYDQGRSNYHDGAAAEDRKAPPPGYSPYRDSRAAPRYGYGGSPSYSQPGRNDPRDDDRYASAQPAPSYGEKSPYGQKSYDRDAGRHDEPQSYDREGSYTPAYKKPKGSYFSYSVQPGETLFDIARRTGLSGRELADFNDIPPSARLYPGQVLHIPKGSGYDRGGRGHDADGDDRGGPAPRGYAPDGYSRGRPFSQNAPADKNGANGSERRMAKADVPNGRNGKTLNDAGNADQAESAGPDKGGSRPMLAAHRDLGTPSQPGNGGEAGAKECESLLSSPAPRAAKTFREPVEGVIVAKYGSKDDGSFNDGIDFSVPKGTPVKAAENGVVAYVGNELPGFGNLVLVRHADGYVTAYAHNDEMLVKRCDVVKRGQVISKAGATGKVTKPELHFELRKDSKPVDPEAFFSRS